MLGLDNSEPSPSTCVGNGVNSLPKLALGELLSSVLNSRVEVRKDLSVRVHHCPSCNYTTDRDVASGQVIRNRGIKLISTDGQSGIQNAYADGLPGIEEIQSRSKSKTRKTRFERSPKEATRKTKK